MAVNPFAPKPHWPPHLFERMLAGIDSMPIMPSGFVGESAATWATTSSPPVTIESVTAAMSQFRKLGRDTAATDYILSPVVADKLKESQWYSRLSRPEPTLYGLPIFVAGSMSEAIRMFRDLQSRGRRPSLCGWPENREFGFDYDASSRTITMWGDMDESSAVRTICAQMAFDADHWPPARIDASLATPTSVGVFSWIEAVHRHLMGVRLIYLPSLLADNLEADSQYRHEMSEFIRG